MSLLLIQMASLLRYMYAACPLLEYSPAAHRDDFGGKTFTKLALPPQKSRGEASSFARRLDDAMTAIGNKQFDRALALVDGLHTSQSTVKRQIQIKALRGLGENAKLIELLNPPQNVDELVQRIHLLIDARRFDDALRDLSANESMLAVSTLKEIKELIAVKRMTM